MRIKNPEKRLASLWGLIDRQHNEQIAAQLRGKRVLDIGCGYGSLVAYLQEQGYDAHGVDADSESVTVAQRLFPHADVRLGRIEELEAEGVEPFDSITLKDCLHHLVGEHHALEAFASIKRLLRPGGRLVILDPNPNWVLKTARLLAAHKDFQTPLTEARELLDQNGFQVQYTGYYEVIGLALSGGYVSVQLVPGIRALHTFVARANSLLSRLSHRLGLGKFICWRYVIAADLAPGPNNDGMPGLSRASRES
jgi:SAM-dependent methyltransferase